METEPKRWQCHNGHIFKKPKLERAALSTFAQIRVHCCPKCYSTKIEERQEWVGWLNANRDRHLEQIKANGGKFLGRQVIPIDEALG